MGKMHLEERTYIVYGREAMSLSSKTKSHSVDFGTVQPHSGVGRGRSIHGISINRVTEEKLQFGCSSIRRGGGGVWKEANSVFICVTGESSWWSPHSLLHSTFNPRIACHSFLTEFFFSPLFSFFFPFLSIHSNLSPISHFIPLFFLYISCNLITSLSLSLVVFDDIRSSLFYNLSFSSPLFAVSFTHIYTHIYTRSFHSPFSIFRSYQN